MMERRCTTPYIPEVQGPLDLSHFEAEQTNKPIFSPPDDMDNPADRLMMSGEHQAAGYQVKDKADLFAASESDNDEFGDDFYFTQSPTADEMTMPLNNVGTATSPATINWTDLTQKLMIEEEAHGQSLTTKLSLKR